MDINPQKYLFTWREELWFISHLAVFTVERKTGTITFSRVRVRWRLYSIYVAIILAYVFCLRLRYSPNVTAVIKCEDKGLWNGIGKDYKEPLTWRQIWRWFLDFHAKYTFGIHLSEKGSFKYFTWVSPVLVWKNTF